MERKEASDSPQRLPDRVHACHHGHLNRRSFLDAAGRLAGGGLAVGAIFEMIRPGPAWGQRPAKETHPSSARVVDRFKTRFRFRFRSMWGPWIWD